MQQELLCTKFSSIRNTKPSGTNTILSVLKEIASEKYKAQIDEIRKHENPSKSPLKDKLPLFTPTGIFSYRSKSGLDNYNGIICLDIDNVDDAVKLKECCSKIDWVYAAFITPSGKGLKVIIKTTATVDTYKDVELRVATKFQELTGVMRDNHCKDIARIQFVSHDPEIFINENSKTF